MARKAISKKIKDSILREFNHRCAICGCERPQIHHIDENAENNQPENLLPLCPNCHLTDQHNPTSPVDSRKLALFRQFKDPLILSTHFEPLFKRICFLIELDSLEEFKKDRAKKQAEELVLFVQALNMGGFYGERIQKLVKERSHVRVFSTNTPYSEFKRWGEEERKEYFEKLTEASGSIIELVVELLRYQTWN